MRALSLVRVAVLFFRWLLSLLLLLLLLGLLQGRHGRGARREGADTRVVLAFGVVALGIGHGKVVRHRRCCSIGWHQRCRRWRWRRAVARERINDDAWQRVRLSFELREHHVHVPLLPSRLAIVPQRVHDVHHHLRCRLVERLEVELLEEPQKGRDRLDDFARADPVLRRVLRLVRSLRPVVKPEQRPERPHERVLRLEPRGCAPPDRLRQEDERVVLRELARSQPRVEHELLQRGRELRGPRRRRRLRALRPRRQHRGQRWEPLLPSPVGDEELRDGEHHHLSHAALERVLRPLLRRADGTERAHSDGAPPLVLERANEPRENLLRRGRGRVLEHSPRLCGEEDRLYDARHHLCEAAQKTVVVGARPLHKLLRALHEEVQEPGVGDHLPRLTRLVGADPAEDGVSNVAEDCGVGAALHELDKDGGGFVLEKHLHGFRGVVCRERNLESAEQSLQRLAPLVVVVVARQRQLAIHLVQKAKQHARVLRAVSFWNTLAEPRERNLVPRRTQTLQRLLRRRRSRAGT
mmetsp:Transcript_28420/g.92815  ORF Transcript_28420/g.92815 Transcript_28420/m.92815 type:complete len:524 (-) Transcript_28420:245-1816(-)